jgi:ribosomal protein L12E/L44/L45/RPP1/RPP2
VNPVEWWDPHWVTDRVMRKLAEAGVIDAAAVAASPPAAAAKAPARSKKAPSKRKAAPKQKTAPKRRLP